MSETNHPLNLIEHYKESHQMVARMYAAGLTDSMIRQKTGYSTRRLTLLKGAPLFLELIAVYRNQIAEKWEANVDAYLDLGMSNMIASERMIAERLDAAEEEDAVPISLPVLDKISQGRADRFGYSKHTVHHHEHDFATALDRAIARSGKAEVIKQIEGRAEPPQELKLISQLEEPVPTPAVPATQPAPRSFIAVLNPIKRRKFA